MALPITVAIALAVSFIVAVFLTPLLCRFFIKKGLHDHDAVEDARQGEERACLTGSRTSTGYWIKIFMNRKWLAFTLGDRAFAFGVILFAFVPQQFFPSAERNQFVIDVWMPQGTRIEATDAVMGRIEKALASRKGVVHYRHFRRPERPEVLLQRESAAARRRLRPVHRQYRLGGGHHAAGEGTAPDAGDGGAGGDGDREGTPAGRPDGSAYRSADSGDDIGELKRLGEKVQEILEGTAMHPVRVP